MILSRRTLDRLPEQVIRPATPTGIGIVHFGVSAFHRAHQAAYVDTLLRDDPRWGIAGVSLRSAGVVDALVAQDCLYTLAIRDAEPGLRVIGAHARLLGPGAGRETLALLARPAVALVTTTVTEKGYCLAPDGTLDVAHPDIAHDLAEPGDPRSVIGWIVAGLSARREAGVAPFTPMPCDNLAANGTKLHAALVAFARRRDAALADWIESEVRVPATMVDAITPATDAALVAAVTEELGVRDRVPVQREAFAQWVIEDIGCPIGPDLASAGAIVTGDVAGFERAKLRILNGAHSTLAYAGLLRGATTVAAAMADAPLAGFVNALIKEDILPMVGLVPGLDLAEYAGAVLARFRNPAIVHRLDQIAQDGSQKLPYRLGDTLLANLGAARVPERTLAAVACWVAFVRARREVVDPAAAELARLGQAADVGEAVAGLARAGLGLPGELVERPDLIARIAAAVTAIERGEWPTVFARGQ